MKTFLQITSEHYKDGLVKNLFLFPTKRSMFAFRKEAEIVNGGPVEHLATITASEFYHRLSGKNPSDRIELLMVLYDCYKELNPAAEPLDEFIFWGDVILQDFNDVDRAMADSRSVYLSVDAYKDLQDYGESLTEAQKKALSTYLGSFEDENAAEGGVKAHMKRIWNILGPLYESFKSAAAAKGLSTEGGLLREVASDSFPLETKIREVTGKDKIVFVGLGSLNACEKALLGRLRDINLAEFVWDCSDPRILADTNLAGRAMEENMKAFPQAFAFGEDLTGRKTVNVIPVPSNVGQVSHVKDILSAMGAEEGRDTVIVLPDASLAPSLLRALPEKALKGINVTMGRKVAGTPLDLLMKAVVNLHVNAKTAPDGTVRYPFNDVLAVFDSPLFRNALDDEDRARTEAVRGNVMMNVKAEDLTVADKPSLLNTVFAPAGFDMTVADADNSHSFGQRLLAVIEGVKVEKESDGTDWQAPFVDAWEKCLKKTMEYRLPVAPVTFVRVLMKMISGQSIPYEMGENGALQVMGPLETRALDFKNVVILSCNEGTFPAPAGNATSLIPYSIRRAFGLPVQEDTDISWAYYFYRLIQRPEQIWVLYDSRTEKTRQGEESRYRSWYNFFRNPDGSVGYDSWWGFPDLPNINEDDLSYRNFIFGKDGVVDVWTSRGASGFRLDVSDELPDSFIRQMRQTVKEKTGGEGAVIGEVWEDASNKCSYGSYRDFMLGNTHDAVMGYTFRHILLDFLCGYIDADIANSRFEGFRERYPKEAYYAMMNLVSSHDVPRIMTMLSRPEDTDDRDIQREFKVDARYYDTVASLAKMAFAFQTCYIGASCIYYGDEILMEGYKDPFNRRTYPWNRVDHKGQEALAYFRRIARIRTENECLRTGYYETLMAEGGTFAFVRYLKEGRDAFGKEASGSRAIVFVMNRSDKPVYVDVSEHYGSFACKASGDEGEIHPLSEQFILGGILGGTRRIGIKPFGTAFLVF